MIERTDTRDDEHGASSSPDLVSEARTIGFVAGDRPGPLVILVGGLHGNEPAGIRATERVLERLAERRERLAGAVLGVRGNVAAVREGVRFLDRDMNRLWDGASIARARAEGALEFAEEREMRELLAVVDAVVDERGGAVVVLDLHSTSAHGPPFAILADTTANRALARELPVPMIFGLDEVVQGALVAYCAARGHAALVFEGGQHAEERTGRLHVAMIWSTLEAAGSIAAADVPDRAAHRAELDSAGAGCPMSVRVAHRHPRVMGDHFRMIDAFEHFHPVTAGDVLATDKSGPIRAPMSGYLMMPSYQDPGDDGFFIGVEMSL